MSLCGSKWIDRRGREQTCILEAHHQDGCKPARGFAAMSPEKQREIASKGGKASHAAGTGHEWDSITASVAGRKGGIASHAKQKAVQS